MMSLLIPLADQLRMAHHIACHIFRRLIMTVRNCLLFTVLFIFTASVQADDWPQWMGPKRDNVWREDGILEKFPVGGPKILWRMPIAGGYAGPAVSGGKVFITDFVTAADVKIDNFDLAEFNGVERVLCL